MSPTVLGRPGAELAHDDTAAPPPADLAGLGSAPTAAPDDSSSAGTGPQRTPAPRGSTAKPDHDELVAVDPAHYVMGFEIARGGMGRIVAARDRRLRRPVAVKELLPGTGGDARRFEREALITARLQHPSIVRLYEAGRWDTGRPFYAMEMVSGRSFDRVIAEARTLDARLALLPHMIAVAEALAYAHAQHIVHRDLKPSNVLVGAFGQTVVIDWGLAKDLLGEADSGVSLTVRTPEPLPALPSIPEPGLTMAGSIMGTPAYMAPEQARGEPVDERADVYALGALLYSMLAGHAPFRGDSSDEVLRAVLERPPERLTRAVPGVPPELVAIVEKAMAPELAARYPTAGELASELRRFQTGQLVAAHRYTRTSLLRRWLRRHRAVVVTAGFALLVLGVMAVLGVRSIVRARDRADHERRLAQTANREAQKARRAAVLRADELVLAQARAALRSDPSASLAWLGTLPVTSTEATWTSAREIAAEAARRGVAMVRRGHGDDINELEFGPGGQLASGSDDATVRLWDARGEARVLRGHGSALEVVRFSPDGRWLVSGAMDQRVMLWPLAGGAGRMLTGHTGTVRAASFSPDGTRVATGSEDGTVRLWSVDVAGTPTELRVGAPVRAVSWLPAGRLAVGLEDGRVILVDETGRALWGPTERHRGTVRIMVVSPDAAWLFTGSEDHDARIWEVATGRSRVLDGHGDVIRGVDLSPDGRSLATASADHTVRLWDVGSGEARVLAGHDAAVKVVRFSGDGRQLASSGSDGVVWLWDTATGAGRPLRGHEAAVKVVAFSPDGHSLASAGDDDTVRVWSLMDPGQAPADPGKLLQWMAVQTNLRVEAGAVQ